MARKSGHGLQVARKSGHGLQVGRKSGHGLQVARKSGHGLWVVYRTRRDPEVVNRTGYMAKRLLLVKMSFSFPFTKCVSFNDYILLLCVNAWCCMHD